MTKVAVYGSLLSDLHNHHVLGDSEYLGEGIVDGVLYDLGSFPGLKLDSTTIQGVKVEVYEVDDKTLRSLDILEGHPNFYCREVVTILFLAPNGVAKDIVVNIYNWKGKPNNTTTTVTSGDWKSYYLNKTEDR